MKRSWIIPVTESSLNLRWRCWCRSSFDIPWPTSWHSAPSPISPIFSSDLVFRAADLAMLMSPSMVKLGYDERTSLRTCRQNQIEEIMVFIYFLFLICLVVFPTLLSEGVKYCLVIFFLQMRRVGQGGSARSFLPKSFLSLCCFCYPIFEKYSPLGHQRQHRPSVLATHCSQYQPLIE